MDRKAICEILVKNEVGEGDLVAYVDYADQGVAAIAHNGMKFTFTNEQLEEAAPKATAKAKPASGRSQKASAKREPKPKARRTTAPAKSGTGKKPATKKPAAKK